MKRMSAFFLLFTAVFAAAVLCFDIACAKVSKSRTKGRNIAVNRINTELSAEAEKTHLSLRI